MPLFAGKKSQQKNMSDNSNPTTTQQDEFSQAYDFYLSQELSKAGILPFEQVSQTVSSKWASMSDEEKKQIVAEMKNGPQGFTFTPKPLFGSGQKFGGFGNTSNPTPTPPAFSFSKTPAAFGNNNTTTTPATSVFGQSTAFGSKPVTTSLFGSNNNNSNFSFSAPTTQPAPSGFGSGGLFGSFGKGAGFDVNSFMNLPTQNFAPTNQSGEGFIFNAPFIELMSMLQQTNCLPDTKLVWNNEHMMAHAFVLMMSTYFAPQIKQLSKDSETTTITITIPDDFIYSMEELQHVVRMAYRERWEFFELSMCFRAVIKLGFFHLVNMKNVALNSTSVDVILSNLDVMPEPAVQLFLRKAQENSKNFFDMCSSEQILLLSQKYPEVLLNIVKPTVSFAAEKPAVPSLSFSLLTDPTIVPECTFGYTKVYGTKRDFAIWVPKALLAMRVPMLQQDIIKGDELQIKGLDGSTLLCLHKYIVNPSTFMAHIKAENLYFAMLSVAQMLQLPDMTAFCKTVMNDVPKFSLIQNFLQQLAQ